MENLKYFDLYPSDIIFEELKNKFSYFCVCQKSVPSLGSPCYKINKLKTNSGAKIEKVIRHRSGEITLCTNLGYVKFTNL